MQGKPILLQKAVRLDPVRFLLSICVCVIWQYSGQCSAQTAPARPAAGEAKSMLQVHTPVGDRQVVTNNHLGYSLKDEQGATVKPMAVVRAGDDLYFLGPDCLWFCLGAKTVVGAEDILVLRRIEPPLLPGLSTPWQEFNDFVYLGARKALIVLDKSGDLFEYIPAENRWGVFRSNVPTTGPPDPDYISLCTLADCIALLDPERNQIWYTSQARARLGTYFKEVLPWRLKRGDANVADGIAIGFDRSTYVLKRDGRLCQFEGGLSGCARERPTSYRYPAGLRP